MEKEIVYPEGSLVFDEKGGELALSRVTGNFSVLTVPAASDEGVPVTKIKKNDTRIQKKYRKHQKASGKKT